MQDDRRSFLKSGLKSAGVALTAAQWSRVLGANDRVHVGVVGLGGRGQDHLRSYLQIPGAEVTALCDVNQTAIERSQAVVRRKEGADPKAYTDMRKLFDDKHVDAVSMPLPNHWHALATIWACQAGKDVYVEKPASHNVWEGLKMIEAARKYKRMVQIGSQSRSAPHIIKAAQLLKDGVIGNVYLSKGLCFKRRKSIGRMPDLPQPPAGVDWDLFLGPAPMRPFNELRFKYNWHWFWDTGNGDIGNQGVHQMDIARWGLGAAYPKSVVSTGGKYAYDDMQETPNTQFATFDYGGKELQFEVRGLLTGNEGGIARRGTNTIGNLFYGSEGWMALDGAGFQVYKGEGNELAMSEKEAPGDTREHMENFLAACKSRKHEDLTADIEIGVISAALCHLANISYRTGKKLNFDEKTMKFIGDIEASRMLTRNYRKPYVVPDKV